MVGTSDPLSKTKYAYDELGRMTKQESMIRTSPSGSNIGDGWVTSTVAYDILGRTVSSFDESSNETTYEYDRLGRLTKVTDPLDNGVTYTYDAVGNVLTKIVFETDGVIDDTFTYRYDYDAENRLVKSYDPTNVATNYTYDPQGNVSTIEDSLGSKSFFEHDELGRQTKVRQQYAGTSEVASQFFYDKSGNLLTARDPRGYDRRFEYDAIGRMTKEWYPDLPTNLSVSYVYNTRGKVVQRTDQNGTTTNFAYDARGLMLTKTLSITSGNVLGESSHEYYSYDQLGRLTHAEDSDSRVKYTYNTLGLVESEELQYTPGEFSGNAGKIVEWDYNSQGLSTAVRYPGATTTAGQLNYAYDAGNRLSTITRQLTSMTTELVADWDLRGSRIIKRTNGNGTWQDVTYDSRGMVTSVTHKRNSSEKIAEVGYSYDSTGAVLGQSQKHYENDGTTELFDHGYSFVYDKAHRLTKAYEGVPAAQAGQGSPTSYESERTYTLDASGNRITVGTTPFGQSQSLELYTANSTNSYTQVVLTGITRQYDYDANGNRAQVSDSGKEWFYDYRNLLVKITTSEDPYTEYLHDVLGRRMCKRWSWQEEEFLYHKEEWHYYAGSALIQEYLSDTEAETETVNLQMEYVWGQSLSEPLQARRWIPDTQTLDVTATFHCDASGSALALTDGTTNADIIESYRYLVHGGATIFAGDTENLGTPFGNKFLWKTSYYDLEVMDVIGGARLYGGSYDPLIGANIQRSGSGGGSGTHAGPLQGNPGQNPWHNEVSPQDIYKGPGAQNKGKKGGSGDPPPRPANGGTPGYGGPGVGRTLGGVTGHRPITKSELFSSITYPASTYDALLTGVDYIGLHANGKMYTLIREYERTDPPKPSTDPSWDLYPPWCVDLFHQQIAYWYPTGRMWYEEILTFDVPHVVTIERGPDTPEARDRYGRELNGPDFDAGEAALATGDFVFEAFIWDSKSPWWWNMANLPLPFKKIKGVGKSLKAGGSLLTSKADTVSRSRNAALRAAKEANGIPRSAQPKRTVKPNTDEGIKLGLDDRNVVLYEYLNSAGQMIHIRLDKPASFGAPGGVGDQIRHFNAGRAFEKLKQHHFFGN